MVAVGDVLLGKYRVESELGRGGMGVVLAARHVTLEEPVAIKIIVPEQAKNADLVRRFVREARAAARIKSEHAVKVADVGHLPSGEPYMVMEMLSGNDLEKLLEDRGPLPIGEAVEYVVQALDAIAEAHAAGIVHRDLKPANMFLTRKRSGAPCVKVLDFGISKFGGGTSHGGAMTQTQGLLGSPLFMSPEQLQSARDVDGRSDIWAMGVVLYQLLTGAFPFVAESLPQLVVQVFHAEPAPLRVHRPEIPPVLEQVVMRCLSKDRSARFANATQLALALAPFGTGTTAAIVTALASAFPSSDSDSPSLDVSSDGDARLASSNANRQPSSVVTGSTFTPLGSTNREELAPPRSSRGLLLVAGGAGAGIALLAVLGFVLLRGGAPAAAAGQHAEPAATPKAGPSIVATADIASAHPASIAAPSASAAMSAEPSTSTAAGTRSAPTRALPAKPPTAPRASTSAPLAPTPTPAVPTKAPDPYGE